MYRLAAYTFMVILLMFAVSAICGHNVRSFELPSGEFSVYFHSVERNSPQIKHSYVSYMKVEKNSFSKVHFVSEDALGSHFSEYRASSTFPAIEFLNYAKIDRWDGKNCYYTKSKDAKVSLSTLNSFISSLKLVNLDDESMKSKQIYDKEVYRLLNDNQLQVWMGTLSVIPDEPILVFVDSNTRLVKYILSEYVMIEVHQYRYSTDAEVKKIVSQLRAECELLDDELNTSFVQLMKRKSLLSDEIKKSETKSWFLTKERACRLPHIKHEETCGISTKDEQVTCIFLHGSGEFEAQEPTNTRENYWGNVHEHTPQCKERWFIWENTRDYGWDHVELQKAYCNLTAFHNKSVEPDTPPVIRNTVVFSHSMGNLILAAALKNGYCSFGDNSSWYAIDSPDGGSVASSKLQQICSDYYYGNGTTMQKLYGVVAESGGYCIPGTDQAYPAYASVGPDYCSSEGLCLNDLRDVIVANVKGAMCGMSPRGLASKYSIALGALSFIVGYNDVNDGMVARSSCEKYKEVEFSSDPSNLWYACDTNHADGTCRNGNGWWGDGRKPCSFYTDKI